jgi:hypothetical protein
MITQPARAGPFLEVKREHARGRLRLRAGARSLDVIPSPKLRFVADLDAGLTCQLKQRPVKCHPERAASPIQTRMSAGSRVVDEKKRKNWRRISSRNRTRRFRSACRSAAFARLHLRPRPRTRQNAHRVPVQRRHALRSLSPRS